MMMTTRDTELSTLAPQSVMQERAGRPGRTRRWLGAGLAVCMAGWGANQFTPMLLLYRSQLGLSAATVEAMFGLYAIGLMPGLLVGGSLSDRIGRRRVCRSGSGTLAGPLADVRAMNGPLDALPVRDMLIPGSSRLQLSRNPVLHLSTCKRRVV